MQLGLQQTSPEAQTHGPPAAENKQGVVSLQDFAVNHLKQALLDTIYVYGLAH
jgi:hypothetical protein